MVYKKDKKGSHVGIVISFVMFIFFVLFFYVIIQPKITLENKKIMADSLGSQIKYNLSKNLTEISILVDNTPPIPSCIKINNLEIGTRVSARGINNGQILPITKFQNDLYVTLNGNLFLHLYSSDVFPEVPDGDQNPLCSSLYNIGLIKKTDEIFESEILRFINDYGIRYPNLKSQMKLPEENDFALDFIYENKTIVFSQNALVMPPSGAVSIYVVEIPIKYLSNDLERKAGILRVKVW